MDILDFGVAIILYFLFFFRKWKNLGWKDFIINTLMYIYIVFVLYFTLMPIITSLPFIFSHSYRPMDLNPFDDLIYNRFDALRQVILNVIMMIPFGLFFPLICKNKKLLFIKTILATFIFSLSIEILQPLLSNLRSSDITDVITNTCGGVIGYIGYLIIAPLVNKIDSSTKDNSQNEQ